MLWKIRLKKEWFELNFDLIFNQTMIWFENGVFKNYEATKKNKAKKNSKWKKINKATAKKKCCEKK